MMLANYTQLWMFGYVGTPGCPYEVRKICFMMFSPSYQRKIAPKIFLELFFY